MAAISVVPDPVFAQEMVGPGIALAPTGAEKLTVCAPADGVVGALFPHAFTLETDLGPGVLVHLGIDTVSLGGAGFELLVHAGQFVRAGEPMIIWDPQPALAQGLSLLCPIVLVQQPAAALTLLAQPGAAVTAGDPLVGWDPLV